jgi:hypothetical protein
MSLFEDTNPRALKELLGDVHNCTMVLPDFQRDFVWEPGATQELVVSIASNYPAGSILRVRDSRRVFAAREFDGAPALAGKHHTFLVLKLDALMDGADFDEAIFHVRAATKWAQKREDCEVQAQELLLPLSVLRGGAGGFGGWSRKVARRLDDKRRVELEDRLDEVEQRWIRVIDDYHFPVVTLSDKTEPDALCTIFETLNRTGVKLSVFELLTARFWPQDINLRQLWDDAKQRYPIVEDFEVDPYYVLQGISLACREAPSCKRGNVLNLRAADITAWWDRIVAGLAHGLEILRDDCKVVQPKWLPYQTMLPPLAAIVARVGVPKTAAAGAQREKLKKWFWCAVFGQVYESAPNSKSAKDVSEVGAWLQGGAAPESVTAFRFDPRALRDVTPRQRSVYRGVICLVLGTGTGARDFHTQSVITGKLMAEEGIDDHHVFPAAYLDKNKLASPRQRDCVLNRTLIDRSTNQVIRDRAPSLYFGDIARTPDFPLDQVLESHCLPTGADSPLLADDFAGFLAWRQDRIWREIRRVTGVATAADLEAEDEEAA